MGNISNDKAGSRLAAWAPEGSVSKRNLQNPLRAARSRSFCSGNPRVRSRSSTYNPTSSSAEVHVAAIDETLASARAT
jgi:hypothetical protein